MPVTNPDSPYGCSQLAPLSLKTDIKRALGIVAQKHGVSMSAYVRELIERDLAASDD